MLLCLPLWSCVARTDSAEAGVMVITETEQTASFVRNFNPLLEVGDVRWPTKHAMYEPLLVFNVLRGDYVPWLAESYAWSPDLRTLRFTLRQGVLWSDGVPLSAGDVAFTFELLARHQALDLRGVWRFLEEAKASGERVVEFRFQRAFVPGLFVIGQQPIVPEHIWKDVADPVTFSNENPVATGPFTEITSFHTQAYQVERNPRYWQPGKPQVKALRFLALPANDQSNLALLSGELDWAGNFVPAIDRVYVEKDRDHNHYWFPLIDGMVLLYANTTVPPFDDANVRKGVSMAIDRDLIVKIAMHNYTRPADATGLSDAFARFRSPAAVARGGWTRLDLVEARKLLDQAGLLPGKDGLRRLRDGSAFHVEVNVPAGFSDWVRAAQVIARGLRKVGIDADLKTYDFNAWYERVQKGEFALSIGWSEVSPTPYNFYRGMMSTETRKPVGGMAAENWHRLGLPRADELLGRLEQTAEPEVQHRLIEELQFLFVDEAPAIPLFPGPAWGEFSTRRFRGFPDAENPYAPLSPNLAPQSLLVLTELQPR
jgi:peptide/nickel transport system substrate-binding protein